MLYTRCPWSHGLRPKKKLSVSVAVPPAPVRVPSQSAPSVASVTSVANDKGENEMILGAVYRSPGICLTAEENPRKPQSLYSVLTLVTRGLHVNAP